MTEDAENEIVRRSAIGAGGVFGDPEAEARRERRLLWIERVVGTVLAAFGVVALIVMAWMLATGQSTLPG